MVAIRFMVGSRTDATRGFPSTRGIEIAPDLIRRLSCQTSNFAIISSTAGREILADNTKDGGSFGDPRPKPSIKPWSGKGVRERFPNLTQLMVKFCRSMPRQLALEVAEPVTKSKPREPLGLKSEIVP